MIYRFYDFASVFYAMPDKGTEITKKLLVIAVLRHGNHTTKKSAGEGGLAEESILTVNGAIFIK